MRIYKVLFENKKSSFSIETTVSAYNLSQLYAYLRNNVTREQITGTNMFNSYAKITITNMFKYKKPIKKVIVVQVHE